MEMLMNQNFEKKLQTLLAKQEIQEVVMRCCKGIDQGDKDIISAAYHSDAHDDHSPYFKGPASEFIDLTMDHRREMRLMHHNITTVNIDLITDIEASAVSYCIFVCESPEGKSTIDMTGCRYFDHFEKREGKWAIAERRLVTDWTISGLDGSVLQEIPKNLSKP